MQRLTAGTIVRLHGPLSLRLWDRMVIAVGFGFVALGALLAVVHSAPPALAAALGGLLIAGQAARERSKHSDRVWGLVADDDDPVRALCLYEYLYRMNFRDLSVVADWRAAREVLGERSDVDAPDAPPQVRAIGLHLRSCPREV